VSIVAADLVFFAAANEPSDDSSTAGGAIDLLRRLDFTQIAANDDIEALSSAAGDTSQTLTITGRDAAGVLVSEIKTLNGTTAVIFSVIGVIERVLKAELSATCAGTITVRRSVAGATIRTIPIGERGFMAPFRQLASDPSSQKDYYVKGFWKNTHGSLTLTSAVVKENADPSAVITHALAASLDDSATTANRITTPGLTFSGADKNVPNSQNLSFGSAIGTWLNLTLAAGAAALKTTYTTELAGQTT